MPIQPMIFLETQVSTAHRVSPWLLYGEGHVPRPRSMEIRIDHGDRGIMRRLSIIHLH